MIQECSKHIQVGINSHICDIEGKKYPISDYPTSCEGCNQFTPSTQKANPQHKKKDNRDPMLKFIDNYTKPKSQPIETTPTKTPTNNPQVSNSEINFKYATGWIISAILAGGIIAYWLIGMM